MHYDTYPYAPDHATITDYNFKSATFPDLAGAQISGRRAR